MPDSPVSRLQELMAPFRARARCPYSRKPEAAALLLADGTWIPGVRVETASFSLAIDASLNAVTTAVAAGRTDIAAVVLQVPAGDSQTAYLEELPFGSLRLQDHLTFVSTKFGELPQVGTMLNPFIQNQTGLDPKDNAQAESDHAETDHADTDHSARGARSGNVLTPAEGIRLARNASKHSFSPLSRFPVGCVLQLDDGRLLPGVNVEHPDWNHILCAERNALGTAVTYGCHDRITAAFVSCARDAHGTPCGACRQVISELAPDSTIVMDRGSLQPESSTPDALLPGSFTGIAILSQPDQNA